MIIYALVARGTLVLAEYTTYDGDFPQMARKVLAKSPRSRLKKTYIKDNYAFTLFSEDEFTFFCMNPVNVGRDITYKFLDRLATLFYSDYDQSGNKDDGATSWSAKFAGQIKRLMEEYENFEDTDKVKIIENDLKSAADTARDNIDQLFERAIKLDILKDKTFSLKNKTETFRMRVKKMRYDEPVLQKYRMHMILILAIMGLILVPYFVLMKQKKVIIKTPLKDCHISKYGQFCEVFFCKAK